MTIREEAFNGKPVSAFVVDAHTHLAPYYMHGWYQTPAETSNSAIIASMDRLGINCIVTAPHMLVMGMMETANKTTVAAIEEFPGRIFGYIAVCPGEGMEVIKAELKKYERDSRFVGLKFLPGYHGSLVQREFQYAADFADERSCVVLTHTWEDNPPLSEVESLAAKRKNMKLICAHQGGGSAVLSCKLAEIMKRQPNIYMDICGSFLNTMAMEDFVELVGENCIIYGSDLINLDVRYDFGRVVLSPLADEVKKKLLSGNFLSLLKDSEMGKISIDSNITK